MRKRRKVAGVTKQFTIEDEKIMANFDDLRKDTIMKIMEEKEDPKFDQCIKYQIAYYITFSKLIGEIRTDPDITDCAQNIDGTINEE